MLREALDRIFFEFPIARNEEFSGHSLADYIRRDIPELLKNLFTNYPNIHWHGSAGQGKWVDAPWIAAFNPVVTKSAMRGYYPVYLFTRKMDAVYLSFNQGMTDLKRELGERQARETLAHRAGILRSRLTPEYKVRFTGEPIDLQPSGPSTRLAFYEPGHAFGIKYDKDRLPSNQILVSDLGEMLRLYYLAFSRGGVEEFDLGRPVEDPIEPDLADIPLEEKRRYRYHRTIERNRGLAAAAKKIHGYICQVCLFDFEDCYGPLGRQYIEAHHKTPLSQIPEGQGVNLSPRDDFAVVCANCHRMLHRSGAPSTFDDFVSMYRQIHNIK